MTLTLNQALFLIITIAVVVAVVVLIRLFSQLRKTAAEGEKALAEFADLARHLKELDLTVKEQVEQLAETIDASRRAAVNVAEASSLFTYKILRPSSRYLPLIIPVARFLWRQVGKRKKERAHVK
jgi:predicted PurR-regulated permease PerM